MERALGIMDRNNSVPDRGERVAGWVEGLMRASGMSPGEFAFKVRADKRDVQRLLADRSCGHRLEDKIAAVFRWDFIEAVMSPVCGGDPLAVREEQLAQRLAEAAAIHARVERERSLRVGLPPRLGMAPVGRGAGRLPPPPAAVESRSFSHSAASSRV